MGHWLYTTVPLPSPLFSSFSHLLFPHTTVTFSCDLYFHSDSYIWVGLDFMQTTLQGASRCNIHFNSSVYGKPSHPRLSGNYADKRWCWWLYIYIYILLPPSTLCNSPSCSCSGVWRWKLTSGSGTSYMLGVLLELKRFARATASRSSVLPVIATALAQTYVTINQSMHEVIKASLSSISHIYTNVKKKADSKRH